MNLNYLLIPALLILAANPVNAGEERDKAQGTVLLKINPISPLASFYEAQLPIATEIKFAGGRFGTNIEIGIPLFYHTLSGYATTRWRDGVPKKLKFDGRLRADFRTYLTPRLNRSWYAGVDIWYRHQAFSVHRTGFRSRNGGSEEYTLESADVKKNITSVGAIWGFQRHFSRRFTLELQLGIGVKYIQLNRYNVVGLKTYYEPYPPIYDNFNIGMTEDQMYYSAWNLSLPGSIRLCYKL